MLTLHKLGISGYRLKSFICLTLTLSPALLTTRMASAQGTSPVDSRQFAYVANENGNDVSGYIIHTATGKLTPIEGSPFITGKSGPTAIAVDNAGGFLYVTNQHKQDNVVAGFSIDCGTGKLTPIPGSPFTAGSGPSSIAIDPSGKFAYVSNSGSNNVSAFKIDQNTGRLSPVSGSPFTAGSSPSSVAVDPLGLFVYVTNESSNNVSGYTINSTTGALTAMTGSPFAAGTGPVSVTIDPNDRFIYVANQGSDNISGYSIGVPGTPPSGVPSPVATSPFGPISGGVTSVTEDPTGGFLYASGPDGVFAYTIEQDSTADAVITPPFPTQLYGRLTSVTGSPFGGEANFAAVDYSGTFLFASNKSSDDVSSFTLSSGVLKPVAGTPFPTGSGPVSIALVRPRTIPVYSATEIPAQVGIGVGLVSIFGAAINNKGQVTGTVTYNAGGERFGSAFISAGGAVNQIAFSRFSVGNDINQSGQVVGQTTLQALSIPPAQAFLYNYSTNTVTVIDNVFGRQSDALGINDGGYVTGSLSTGTCTFPNILCNPGDTHAFIYTGSGLVDIGTLGGTYSAGTSINNLNQIVGISSPANSALNHLFLYAQGQMHDLGAPSGESFVNAAINNHGEIIGSTLSGTSALTLSGTSYIRQGLGFRKLPILAGGLNDNGDIVGTKVVKNGSRHAFVLYGGVVPLDLNLLVEPSVPFLTYAGGISDNGKIVASGVNGNLYILTPQ